MNQYLEGLSQADLRSADLGRTVGHGCKGSPSPIFSPTQSAGSQITLSKGVTKFDLKRALGNEDRC